ncbi:MAG: hypothetical protein ACM31C_28225 [Acidobacteriota bacterium]
MLTLVVGCAAAPEHRCVQMVASYDSASALLPLALDAARAQHLDIAALDTARGAFAAIDDSACAAVRVVYVVNIEPLKYARQFRYVRVRGKYVAIGVTPLAFAGGRELPRVPAAADARAEQLLLAIYDRTRSERELF